MPQLGDSFESMYISEKRLAGIPDNDQGAISPGTRTICHAMATISAYIHDRADDHQIQIKVKLDSCGSVSIAHSNHLIQIKKAKDYGLQNIRLLGIGGKTNFSPRLGFYQYVSRVGTSAPCFVTFSIYR